MENYIEQRRAYAQKERVDFLSDMLKEAHKEKRELEEYLNFKKTNICKMEDQFEAEKAILEEFIVKKIFE